MQEIEQNTIPEFENSPPENIHTAERLKELQALPLERKIQITKSRIIEWYKYWNGQVYVSFSGGKDSTVLLHLVRGIFPDVEAVYVDTGLEYPELRQFVKTFDNVTWLKPEMNFRQVLDVYGYPLITKEVARDVGNVQRNGGINSKTGKHTYSYKYLNGDFATVVNSKGEIEHNRYDKSKWKFLIDAPFKISNKCCDIMKKKPARRYAKSSGKKPYFGIMATESALRASKWVQFGCNAYDCKSDPQSNPMSFWTEQDVLEYCFCNKIQLSYLFFKNQ